MKWIGNVLLILLTLGSTLKASVVVHYCQGEVQSIAFLEKESCCKGKPMQCCSDTSFELENDQNLNSCDTWSAISPILTKATRVKHLYMEDSELGNPPVKINFNKPPPKLKLFLAFKSLVVYA